MQKVLIALLSLTLALSIGCDDPEPEEEADEVEEQEEAVDEEDDEPEEEAAADDGDEADDAAAQAEEGAITVTATRNSFEPSTIEAPAGEELTLEFLREVDDGCMTEVVFPDLELEKQLPTGEAVTVTVTPEEGEAIAFECGMGMGQSTITGI